MKSLDFLPIIIPMNEPGELREKITQILDAHRRGHWDKLRAVEMLRLLFESLPAQEQGELCEHLGYALRTEPLGTVVVRGVGVNIVGVVFLALARFGPTQHLAEFAFSRIHLENPEETETWAREVYPDLRYCLYENGDRFSDETLSRIGGDLGKYRPPNQPIPLPLIEALGDLEFVIEHIKLTRFEHSLRRTVSEQKAQPSDLESSLAAFGFNPRIATAMKDAENHLRGSGVFDPKKAADLLRTCMDETHRSIVEELAKIKQESYPGKNKDFDRRAYMRQAGFISPPEEKFITCVYALISEEASHKLEAPKETVLVLQTTVHNYLLLLLKRLSDWNTRKQRSAGLD